MDHRCPERRGGTDGKRVAHRPTVEISDPHCDRVFLIETDCPGIAKSAASSSFRGDSFVEREWRIRAKAFFARAIVGQNVGDDLGRFGRRDRLYREMFGGEKFRAHSLAFACQTGVCTRKIDKTNLGVAENKARAVVAQAATKFEAPLLQFIKRGTRAELTQRKNRRHFERAAERFPQAHRAEITMIEVL